jgi:hypothetical protein
MGLSRCNPLERGYAGRGKSDRLRAGSDRPIGEFMMPQDAPAGLPGYKIKTIGAESTELADFQIPTFINSINIWFQGQDVYIDMALLTVEQLRSLEPGSEVTVAVHDRFVMSPSVFDAFAKSANQMHDQLKKQGLIQDAKAEPAKE